MLGGEDVWSYFPVGVYPIVNAWGPAEVAPTTDHEVFMVATM